MPMGIMIAILAAVLLSHRGLEIDARAAQLEQLTTAQGPQADQGHPELLLLTGQHESLRITVTESLEQMKIPYMEAPAEQFGMQLLEGIHTVLLLRPDLESIGLERLVQLVGWVEEGGRFALMTQPEADDGFALVSRKLGIVEYESDAKEYLTLRFRSGLLPLWGDGVFDTDLNDYTLPVRLDDACSVYLQTADEAAWPIMWTRPLGSGRVAVLDANLTLGKDSRGYIMNLLSVLEDALVYPIINAGMVFVDDFPAPQPAGFDQRLKETYGFSTQGFFRNRWWPDMKRLTWTEGVRYTGVLVETYNDNVTGPFVPDSEERGIVRFYSSEILQSGGEIGLHGYNHQPLCPEGFGYADEGYNCWPGTDRMAQAIRELVRYGHDFLPNAQFATYVPPSNYLSDVGQAVLLSTVQGLRTISGLYLPEDGMNTLTQEFAEEDDGSISVPRITAGFSIDDYNRLVMAQELGLHGVLSHFVHPDDVLDDERGAALGWERMYQDFQELVGELNATYRQLRWSTASEGAAAVQRYDRVGIERRMDGHVLQLRLSMLYDEVWLALWSDAEPVTVSGAELYRISDRLYWLRATQPDVCIAWEEAP
ncbi:MAG: DUF2194 domain-containing protein [Candidatus Ventricola sp.]